MHHTDLVKLGSMCWPLVTWPVTLPDITTVSHRHRHNHSRRRHRHSHHHRQSPSPVTHHPSSVTRHRPLPRLQIFWSISQYPPPVLLSPDVRNPSPLPPARTPTHTQKKNDIHAICTRRLFILSQCLPAFSTPIIRHPSPVIRHPAPWPPSLRPAILKLYFDVCENSPVIL